MRYEMLFMNSAPNENNNLIGLQPRIGGTLFLTCKSYNFQSLLFSLHLCVSVCLLYALRNGNHPQYKLKRSHRVEKKNRTNTQDRVQRNNYVTNAEQTVAKKKKKIKKNK